MVRFYETIEDSQLKFAVIISHIVEKLVFCKHKDRDTYEIPGGHREPGETIRQAAERELREETGAVEFEMHPICVYSVTGKTRAVDSGEETFGMLYHAQIHSFEKALHNEIAQIELFEVLPDNWTYPQIQPLLLREYERRKV